MHLSYVALALASVAAAQTTLPSAIQLVTAVNSANSTLPFSLKTLFKFIDAANLTNAVLALTSAPVTIFAPADDAIDAALTAMGIDPTANFTNAQVGMLLTTFNYHVIPGVAYALPNTTVANHTLLTSMSVSNSLVGKGYDVIADLKDGKPLINRVANVIYSAPILGGGIIHVIDQLLVLPKNVSKVAANEKLTVFATAINQANATSAIEALSGVTILAPRDTAFTSIDKIISSLTLDNLTAVLEYHIIPGVHYSTDILGLTGTTAVPTYNGDNLNVTVVNGTSVTFSAGNVTAKVVGADYLIANGVLHIIDTVLIPSNLKSQPLVNIAPVSTAVSRSAAATATSSVAPTSTQSRSGAESVKLSGAIGASVILIAALLFA